MSVELMRKELISCYPGKSWAMRVQKMPEAQVIAIYLRIKEKDVRRGS